MADAPDRQAEDAAQHRLRKAGVVAGATLVSRMLGFVRDMVVAMALGAGPMADAFFVAFRIPEALRRMLGEGTFSMAVGPALAQARTDGGRECMFQLGRCLLLWGGLVVGPLTALAMLQADLLVEAIAPGFADAPELAARAAVLLAICMPYLLTTVAAGICVSMLHVLDRFLTPALSPCLLNVVLIAAAGLGAGLGQDVAVCLAAGLLVAGVGQVWLQLPDLRRQGFVWIGRTPLRPAALARVGRELVPTMLGAFAFQIMLMLASFRGTALGIGTTSALYYADRLLQFPLGLAGVAISTVALPELAALHARGEQHGFVTALRGALRASLFLAVPAAVGLLLLARPVVVVLFGRGQFDAHGVTLTTAMLQWFALALPALAMTRPLLAAAYAQGRHRLTVLAGAAGVAAFVLAELLFEWTAGPRAPAMALGVGAWLQAFILGRGSAWRMDRADAGWLIRMIGLGLAMAGGIAWVDGLLPASSWLRVACIPGWAAAFGLGALLLRVPEAVLLGQMLRRRLRRT